jgi:hypothetical protein
MAERIARSSCRRQHPQTAIITLTTPMNAKSLLSAIFLFAAAAPFALAGSLSVKSENGSTTVVWNGQEVWKGETSGKVSSASSSENGKEFAAAFDGDRIIWESEAGAAQKVKAPKPMPEFKPDLPAPAAGDGKSSTAGISTSTVNGETVVTWNGKEVWRGKTSGKVAAKAVSEDGKQFAAVLDDGKVLWESEKGAGKIVRKKLGKK